MFIAIEQQERQYGTSRVDPDGVARFCDQLAVRGNAEYGSEEHGEGDKPHEYRRQFLMPGNASRLNAGSISTFACKCA